MKAPASIFREYDIRGVADRDLTSDVAHAIGRGLATVYAEASAGKRLRIAVGRDCRESSPRLAAQLIRGFTRAGVDIVDVGVGPTPYLYSAVHLLDVDGGVMITGSHNPGDENGFKIMRGLGSFFGESIQHLRRIIDHDAFVADANEPGNVTSVNHEDDYVSLITSGIQLHRTDIRFVVDAGNGAGGPLALRAMRSLGLDPDSLFCDMDGRFPNHHPDPTVPKNLEALIDRVRSTGARVGIAYDGDADRIGAVDASGDIIWGDKLLLLFARDVLASNPGAAVLGEVKCSQTLYNDIASHGGRPIMWKTGHSLIKSKMKEEKALLAGEMSGHIFFADRFKGFDDALYASLRLIEILSRDPRTLREMLADVPHTVTTPELRIDCPDGIKFSVVNRVRDSFKSKGFSVVDIDGARVNFGTETNPAWGLVRASNTGPILVMRFEAGTQGELDRIRSMVEAEVAAAREALHA